MATGIQPLTVAEAGPIMAKAMGFDWAKDRLEVVEYLNRYRLLLYTGYDKFQLFDNVFHTVCIQQFGNYQGFTLPPDVEGLSAVWYAGDSLKIRSRWREFHTGEGVNSLPRVEVVMMAEQFATELDLESPSKIKLFSEHEDDNGKKVRVEVEDSHGRPRCITFTLVGDGVALSSVKVRKILSVSLPSDRKGSVILMTEKGSALSQYAPWESVPTYQRFKIATYCKPGCVRIQGTRKFTKVYFDQDIVEIGNQLIIESIAKFFKIGDNTTDMKELQIAQYHKTEAEKYLLGELARHQGSAIQDGTPFKGSARMTARKKLPGY